MVEITKMEFNSWTDYDNWLIENYQNHAIFSVNEVDGKIKAEMCAKEDWQKFKEEQDSASGEKA